MSAFVARDWLVLLTVIALAAIVRFPGLDGRGQFDADQGSDMLVLSRFVHEGVVPLLGPQVSVGEFHQGALYYLLVAPAAAISNVDPSAILFVLTGFGLATVALTWWLAGSIGGRKAGLLAGALMALSPTAIQDSTFIWSANPLPLFAALALAAAWRAHATGRARWWVLALAAAAAVAQLHLVGIVFAPSIVGLLIVDLRRAQSKGDRVARNQIVLATFGGLAGGALLFAPLAIHEVQTGLAEAREIVRYLVMGHPEHMDVAARTVLVLMRSVSWPFSGVITAAPIASFSAFSVAAALCTWLVVTARGERAAAARWLLATVVWSTVVLSVVAPSLDSVIPALPNDQYHAFLDPVIVVLVAVAAAAMAAKFRLAGADGRPADELAQSCGSEPARSSSNRVGLASLGASATALVLLFGIMVWRWPPGNDPDGGWPAARAAGVRIVELTRGDPIELATLPEFKVPDGISFPILYAGGVIVNVPSSSFLVVQCDRLFENAIGLACGGPAEAELLARDFADAASSPPLTARFDASPRISISIYRR